MAFLSVTWPCARIHHHSFVSAPLRSMARLICRGFVVALHCLAFRHHDFVSWTLSWREGIKRESLCSVSTASIFFQRIFSNSVDLILELFVWTIQPCLVSNWPSLPWHFIKLSLTLPSRQYLHTYELYHLLREYSVRLHFQYSHWQFSPINQLLQKSITQFSFSLIWSNFASWRILFGICSQWLIWESLLASCYCSAPPTFWLLCNFFSWASVFFVWPVPHARASVCSLRWNAIMRSIQVRSLWRDSFWWGFLWLVIQFLWMALVLTIFKVKIFKSICSKNPFLCSFLFVNETFY